MSVQKPFGDLIFPEADFQSLELELIVPFVIREMRRQTNTGYSHNNHAPLPLRHETSRASRKQEQQKLHPGFVTNERHTKSNHSA